MAECPTIQRLRATGRMGLAYPICLLSADCHPSARVSPCYRGRASVPVTRTYLAPEEHAYPHGGQNRRCRAICPDGKARTVWAGIPDTYFTIPAHCRIGGKYAAGYLTVAGLDDANEGELVFTLNKARGVSQ